MDTKGASDDEREQANEHHENGEDERDEKGGGEEDTDEKDRKQGVKPARKKIGETPDNLRRRGEWFRRRTGESGPPPKSP